MEHLHGPHFGGGHVASLRGGLGAGAAKLAALSCARAAPNANIHVGAVLERSGQALVRHGAAVADGAGLIDRLALAREERGELVTAPALRESVPLWPIEEGGDVGQDVARVRVVEVVGLGVAS